MAKGYIDPYGFSKGTSSGGGSSSSGYVDPYGFGKSPKAAKPQHHGGGGIGGFFHSVGHFLGDKAGRAAHDIEGMPGGVYLAGKALAHDVQHPHNLGHLGLAAAEATQGDIWGARHNARRSAFGKKIVLPTIKGTYESVRHPLRDPFQTALTVLPGVDVAGRVGEAGIVASDAARAGEGATAAARAAGKALTHHGEPTPRILRVGEDRTKVNLLGSKNAGVRLAQRGYDRMVQHALDREARGEPTGRAAARIAKHGMKRVTGAQREEQLIEQKLRLVPADMLDRSAVKLLRRPANGREEQAALELTSTQTPAEEAAAYHYGKAREGVNPKQNLAVAKLYERVAKRGLVHVDETRPAGEKVHINPEHERLAMIDAKLADVQKRGDTMLEKHGVMSAEELQQRTNAPARIRAGATYEKPTPGKNGIPSAKLEHQRGYVNRLQRLSDRAQERVQKMQFTAADRKRIGNMSPPVDAIKLREQLRPLDKRLRQLTEEWNAPAKAGGQMTEAEAHARLAELDDLHNELVDKTVPLVSPYTREENIYGKTFDREQLRRNTMGGKGGKYGKMKSVKQEERDLAEAKIHELIAKHPDHPVLKRVADVVHERDQLSKILTQRAGADIMGEEPLPLPGTGGKSPYEQRAAIHRVLRKGTTAEKAVREFSREAGTDSTVHGLNDLKERAAELTDRINELRGTPGPEIKKLRKQIGEIRRGIRAAEAPYSRVVRGERPRVITGSGDVVRPVGAARADRIGAALGVAKDRLEQLEAAAARRQKPTGIVGGEQALPGRGFVSERISQKRLARAEAASSRSQVTGVAREPIDKKPYTGRALEQGLRPKSVTTAASQHYRQIARFEATDALRRRALTTGSTLRRSTRDVLIRVPDEKAGPISLDTKQILGMEKSTVDKPEELATQAGLEAAHQMFLTDILDRVKASKAEGIGVKAPDGYRWVDENTIKGLQDEARPKGGPGASVGRAVDNVNAAVTSLTVYFKIGHIGTRVLTNAATNIMQGSMRPDLIAKSFKLWRSLSDEEKARMLSASGQHGFAALPMEGTEGAVGRAISGGARHGARFWARHADAPFRFNALAHTLREAGYSTPAEIRRALDGLESGGKGLPAHEWSKISAAARRADRDAISYDRLNPFEKRYLTRGIWFYPWVKGSTVFTVRSLLEHPYKAAAIGALGAAGVRQQEKLLGPVPSYEEGLVPLTGGKHPLTTDFTTFSPFGTAADLLNIPGHPGALAEQFNPAVGAAGQFTYGLNAYGAPSNNPYRDALLALAAPTPEQQLAEAYAARHEDQSQRMFHKTPGGIGLRYLVGPAYPRRVNRAALARAAKRERSGQR